MKKKRCSTATTSRKTSPSGSEGAKLSIHPLFFLAGVVSAFTGRLLYFISACLAAIEHECAHAFAARRYGVKLNKIILMPYGAVIKGDLAGLTPREELWVLVAGPLSNAATALFFVALWWLFPESYPYTEAAAVVSASLFIVNLLPAYPLDGGRAIGIFFRRFGKKRARVARIVLTSLVVLFVAGYFVYTCFHKPNASALFFAVMLLAGEWGGESYSRMQFLRKKSFLQGVEERRVAVSGKKTVGEALRFLREDRYVVFVLYDGEEFVGELSESEFMHAIERGEYQTPLENCLADFSK